jgi:hypothetical protein
MVNTQPLLTPAMQAYLIALIYRNTRTSCLSLAQLSSSVSHDTLNRLLHASFPWSRRLWELLASRMILEGGYLVLDDTPGSVKPNAQKLSPKFGLRQPAACVSACKSSC